MGFGEVDLQVHLNLISSDLSHPIKEVEMVDQKIINACLAFHPAYLIGKCIDQEREESALAILCTEAPKRRKRETVKSAQQELCNPFTKDNKDKVPVDVATSLVVNHVNLGALCLFMLCL